jgi:hypothetical protein
VNYRANAAVVIARRRVFEAAIHPGFSIALAVALAIAYMCIAAFVRSIDSSGFNSKTNPFYWFLGGLLASGFGETFASELFSHGPFLLAANAAFLPVLLYLSLTSIHKFGSEKAAGAIELLTYGPSDGTAYFLASMLKDMILSALTLVLLLVFFALSVVVENLVFDSRILGVSAAIFFTAVSVCSYGVFISVMTETANSAVALFLGGFVLLMVVLVGSYTLGSGSVHGISIVAAWVVQWFSPFFYWSLCVKAASAGDTLLFIAGLAGQVLLAGAALAASHHILRKRGVRA